MLQELHFDLPTHQPRLVDNDVIMLHQAGTAAVLTASCPLMMTSSAKRTFTGFDFSLAFLAALIKADLGD